MAGNGASAAPLRPVEASWVYQFGRIICRSISARWFDLKAYGVQHVPRRGGAVIVSNHQSYLDPVVPAVIDGSCQAWPRGAKMFRQRPIRVMYGPVMDLKDFKAAEIVRRIDVRLRRMFEELRRRERLITSPLEPEGQGEG